MYMYIYIYIHNSLHRFPWPGLIQSNLALQCIGAHLAIIHKYKYDPSHYKYIWLYVSLISIIMAIIHK